jgi:hypothetical protein
MSFGWVPVAEVVAGVELIELAPLTRASTPGAASSTESRSAASRLTAPPGLWSALATTET